MDQYEAKAGLVYLEALRALDQQASVVENIRSRAGLLLSAAAVTTSFFAGIAVGESGDWDPWGWAAAVAFVGVALLTVWLLWPRHDWRFHSNAKTLVRDYLDRTDVTLAQAQRNLALHMDSAFHQNSSQIRWMFVSFEAACFALALEVAFWIVGIA